MVTFVEFFCMLIRKLGGADALRASLKQFEMREDGTIEREWLEGKIGNRKNLLVGDRVSVSFKTG